MRTRPVDPPPQSGGALRGAGRGRSLNVAGRVAVGLTSLLVLTGTGIASTMLTSLVGGLSTSDALDSGAPKSAGADQNILLIGLDSRKDQDGNQLPKEILDQLHAGDGTEGGYNTNTLILMHIPGDGAKATAVSIPRDDYVPVQGIPGYTHAKIKEAYGLAKFYAEQDLKKQGVTGKPTWNTGAGRPGGRRPWRRSGASWMCRSTGSPRSTSPASTTWPRRSAGWRCA